MADYAEDPHWVPPLLMEVKEFLNRRKHPFYKHGEATQYIALRGDETVGRILVSDDPRYNQDRGENLGCFGMFECDNDQAAANGLLDAAAGWLALAAARSSAAQSTIRSTIRAVCWSKGSTRRRES